MIAPKSKTTAELPPHCDEKRPPRPNWVGQATAPPRAAQLAACSVEIRAIGKKRLCGGLRRPLRQLLRVPLYQLRSWRLQLVPLLQH